MPVPMGEGPAPARVMIVGEAWGEHEERAHRPFIGPSGALMNSLLHEAGLMRSECYVTNVVNARPPNNEIGAWIAQKKKDITPAHIPLRDKYVLPIILEGVESLKKEIALVNPEVIIAFGNTPLWALTGAWGITKWRGSTLSYSYQTEGAPGEPLIVDKEIIVIPVFHPAAVLRQWDWKNVAIQDLRRAKKALDSPPVKPKWNFIVRPSFAKVIETLDTLICEARFAEEPIWIDFDTETRGGHIACAGISWSLTDALCIPLMCVENQDGYWSLDEEAIIIYRLYQLLTHPKVKVRWQNGLYDAQYTYRHWCYVPNGHQDTMISQHTLWAGLKKALDFQASMYCEYYVYWKDDGKTWDKNVGEDQLWAYNCVDCVRTREVGEVEAKLLDQMGLAEVDAFQQKLFYPVLRAMQRGVRIDKKARNDLIMELQEELDSREAYFFNVLGHSLNPRSPTQMKKLFYEDLQQRPIFTRAKKGVPGHLTLDDKALETIAKREPLLKPLINNIQEYRSLGVFLSTFAMAPLDIDGRMRCSYNVARVETYRLSSSENAFDTGTNLQNLPHGTDSKLRELAEHLQKAGPKDIRAIIEALGEGVAKTIQDGLDEGALITLGQGLIAAGLLFPNIRKLFIPDPGYTFFDMDLDRADLQVVVWEADDDELKAMLREGVDIHAQNALTLGITRALAKAWVHGTNYGGGPRTMAINCGITVHQAEQMQSRWFAAHPGIKRWHDRTEQALREKRYVTNKFGYRRYYFERVDGLLPEALAWIPQSTVGIYINKIWVNIYDNLPEVQVLLQVHDSLAGQIPTHKLAWYQERIKEQSQVIIPYDDPLIIPTGIKTSAISWGDCG